LLAAALVAVVVLFVQTRNLNWRSDAKPNSSVNSVYELERKLDEKSNQLNAIKAGYAKAVISFREEKLKIEALEISDLEKIERTNKLKEVYSEEYFAAQTKMVNDLKSEIEELENLRCSLICE
jgi:preprotein translocase subunit SecF